MIFSRPLSVLFAVQALLSNVAGKEATPEDKDPAAAREMLDGLRRRVAKVNGSLAGQESTASALGPFDEIRPHFVRWQTLLKGSAAEPTAEAAMTYVDDTRAAVESGKIEVAAPLLQELDQMVAFLKREVPTDGGGPATSDAAARASAMMTPLLMRLRAAFFALVEGNAAGASVILMQARERIEAWAVLYAGTSLEQPAVAYRDGMAQIAETLGKGDPKRVQAMVDALEYSFSDSISSFQKNQKSSASASAEKMQRELKRITDTPDDRLLGEVLVPSLPKRPAATPEQAVVQLPAMRDALDEVYQTLWVTGRTGPSLQALDLFRATFDSWRKPLASTAAGPLTAAFALYLDDVRQFLVDGQLLTAQTMIRSILGGLQSAAEPAKLPAGHPFAELAVAAVLDARLAMASGCLRLRLPAAGIAISKSLQESRAWAARLKGTPDEDVAGVFVSQVESMNRLFQGGNKSAALQLCRFLTVKNKLSNSSTAARAGKNGEPPNDLASLGVWLKVVRELGSDRSASLSLMDLGMMQFDQWKTRHGRKPGGPVVEAVALCAANIRTLLAENHPDAAGFLATAFLQYLPLLEESLDACAGQTPPDARSVTVALGTVVELRLRAMELALDSNENDPNPKAALAILGGIDTSPEGWMGRLGGANGEVLRKVLADSARHLAEALEKGKIVESKALLAAFTRQIRIVGGPPAGGRIAQTNPPGPPANGSYEIAAQDDLMPNVASAIARKYGLRLCFEEIDLDSRKDAITAAAMIRDLENRAMNRQMTTEELGRLEDRLVRARQARKEHGPDILLDSGAPRLTFSVKAASPEEMLEKLTEGTRYAWRKIESCFVILPRSGSVLDFPVTADVGGLTVLNAVMRIVAQRPQGAPIDFVMVGTGVRDPSIVLKTRVPPLVFRQKSALEALCLLTGATQPELVWNLAGYRAYRFLGLHTGPESPLRAVDQTPPDRDSSEEEKFVLEFKNDTMVELIERIRASFPERVCFERSCDDFLSADEVIRRLNESARFEPLSEAQKDLLAAARTVYTDKTFDASLRFSGRAVGATFEGFLDDLTRRTPYSWRKTGGAFVVFPSFGSISQTPLTVKISSLSPQDAVRETLQLPPEMKLQMESPAGDPLSADFDSVTVAEALCRIAGSLQPPCRWNIEKSGETLSVVLSP